MKLIISKGHYSAKKTKQELRFLFSTRRLMLFNICTKFQENILDCIKVTEQTRFSLEIFQRGHHFTKIVGGVTVLVLCTMPGTSLFLYPVS